MLNLHLEFADGSRRTILAHPGQSLMRAAVDAGIAAIAADCGGCLNCATCHVHIGQPWSGLLPPPGADEAAMLEMTAAPRSADSRLACQIVLTTELDGLQARLPDRQY
jgi:2Fe-2S ferredoxin